MDIGNGRPNTFVPPPESLGYSAETVIELSRLKKNQILRFFHFWYFYPWKSLGVALTGLRFESPKIIAPPKIIDSCAGIMDIGNGRPNTFVPPPESLGYIEKVNVEEWCLKNMKFNHFFPLFYVFYTFGWHIEMILCIKMLENIIFQNHF